MGDKVYKIEININKSTEEKGTLSGDGVPAVERGVKSPRLEATPKMAAGIAAAISIAKNMMAFATSSVEMYTGNSVAQTQINNIMTMAGPAVGIIVNPWAAAATIAVSVTTHALQMSNEVKWENKQAEMTRRRGGTYLSSTAR